MDGMHAALMLTFYVGIYGIVGLVGLWLIAALIGSMVAARQRRYRAMRRGHDYRVGGCISP